MQLVLVNHSPPLRSVKTATAQVPTRLILPQLELVHDLGNDNAHLQVRQVLTDAASRPARKGAVSTLRLRNTLSSAALLSNDPSLGAELEGFVVKVGVVVQNVGARARAYTRREILPIHGDTTCQDLSRHFGRDRRAHTQDFFDESLKVLAVTLKFVAALDIIDIAERGADFLCQPLLDSRVADKIEHGGSRRDRSRVTACNDEHFTLTEQLRQIIARLSSLRVDGAEEVVEEILALLRFRLGALLELLLNFSTLVETLPNESSPVSQSWWSSGS